MRTPRLLLVLLPLAACNSLPEKAAAPPPPAIAIAPANVADLLADLGATAQVQIGFDPQTKAWLSQIPVTRRDPGIPRVLLIGSSGSPPAATASDWQLVPLQYAQAEEAAQVLDLLVRGTARRGDPEARILADARTNSLLIAASTEDMARLKDLVARLDVEVGG